MVAVSQLWVPMQERANVAVPKPAARALSWASGVLVAVAVAIAYFLAARLSLVLVEKTSGVAVFWPAAGVASGALIVAGSRARDPLAIVGLAGGSSQSAMGSDARTS